MPRYNFESYEFNGTKAKKKIDPRYTFIAKYKVEIDNSPLHRKPRTLKRVDKIGDEKL